MQPIAVPTLTAARTQRLEQLLPEQYALDLLQIQENAGRNLAEMARVLLEQDILDRPIVLLAGRGNNGAVGMVAARHLLNWGADIQVLCSDAPEDYQGVPAQQLRTLQAMGAPLAWAEEGWELPPCDLVIDAIIGYGLRSDPHEDIHGRARDLIQLANSAMAPILSLDAPSGLDSDTGTVYTPCIQATATLCMGLPQQGLATATGAAVCGELFVGDVGIPAALYADLEMDADVPWLFSRRAIVPLRVEAGTFWIEPTEQ
ncbi:MAG: NAD(P)H-hydrate epimerase [Litorilinea sp.]